MSPIVKPQPTPEPPLDPRRLAAVPDLDDWADVGAAWVRSLRAEQAADLTITAYLASYRRLAAWAATEGIAMPEDVTREHLEEFIGYLRTRITRHGRPAAKSTVAKDYRHLRVFFNWLAGKDDVASPMAKMKQPRVPKKPIPMFTDDQLKALVKACAGRDFTSRRDTAIMRLLLDTGMRRAELAGLTLDSFTSLDDQVVHIVGKREKERDVFYGAKTAEALDDYLRMRRRHPDRNLNALWLAAPPHRGALGYEGVRLMLERRATQAGVPDVFAHRFRHTAVHAFLEAGGTEGEAMSHFGWDSRAMLDRYGAAGQSRRAIKKARQMSVGDRI